jgi:hypothetical protein
MAKRVAKTVLIGLAVIAALMAALSSNYLKKPPGYPHLLATDIASGVLLIEEGYDSKKAIARLGPGPECSDYFHNHPSGDIPYILCLQVLSNNYEGCGMWSSERSCVSLFAWAALFKEPDRLGRIIDSLAHPCKYLPKPGTGALMALTPSRRESVSWAWTRLACTDHSDEFPGKVILVLKDNDGREVMKIVKPARD